MVKTIRSQSGLELLIIAAAIIVVALFVIYLIRDTSPKGGQLNEGVDDLVLSSQPIGIMSYAVSQNNTTLIIVNNNRFVVRVLNITVNGTELNASALPTTLLPSEQRTIWSTNVTQLPERYYNFPVVIEYTDLDINSSYNQTGTSITGFAAS